jgi:hypothetical protein
MRAYYGGLNQRPLVTGAEGWQFTDEGTAVITSKRIVFRGASKAVEWAFSKLAGVDVDTSNNCMVLQVTNRQSSHVLRLVALDLFIAAFEAAQSGEPGLHPPDGSEMEPGQLPSPRADED